MSTTKSVSVSQVRGMTASEIAAFQKAGLKTTAQVLQATPDGKSERDLAKRLGLTAGEVHEAHNRADLIRVAGLGPATADLFENAGVNSALELSHRSAASLEKSLQAYVAAHADQHLHAPSLKTVAQLINGAKAVVAPAAAPLTQDQARPVAAAALNRYIDDVLFSSDPAGASFRSNLLEGHTQAEQDAIRKQLHDSVGAMVGDGSNAENSSSDEVIDGGDRFTFVGSLDGLHTEVEVAKDGTPGRILVEID